MSIISTLLRKKNALTPELYCEFHRLCGFMEYEEEDVKEALLHTLYSVVIYDEEQPVGIARVVGDGRIVFLIKDVMVRPDYQQQGIGSMLMESLMEYIREHGCFHAYVALMAVSGTEEFYERMGFIRRPVDSLGAGMVLFLE